MVGFSPRPRAAAGEAAGAALARRPHGACSFSGTVKRSGLGPRAASKRRRSSWFPKKSARACRPSSMKALAEHRTSSTSMAALDGRWAWRWSSHAAGGSDDKGGRRGEIPPTRQPAGPMTRAQLSEQHLRERNGVASRSPRCSEGGRGAAGGARGRRRDRCHRRVSRRDAAAALSRAAGPARQALALPLRRADRAGSGAARGAGRHGDAGAGTRMREQRSRRLAARSPSAGQRVGRRRKFCEDVTGAKCYASMLGMGGGTDGAHRAAIAAHPGSRRGADRERRWRSMVLQYRCRRSARMRARSARLTSRRLRCSS